MSTVPTAMIFDDHDIRDDWNTSAPWRADMAEAPWWQDRIRAGLASYWVYQHLGNLSPDELADDEDYQRLLATEGDAWPHLAELAERADREVDCNKGVRFSYRWDLGRSRLIMVDSRNGRILESGERMMIGEQRVQLAGVEGRGTARITGPFDARLVGAVADAAGHRRPGGAQRAGRRPRWQAGQVRRKTPPGSRFRSLAGVLQVVRAVGGDDRQDRQPPRRSRPRSACCRAMSTTVTPRGPNSMARHRAGRPCISWCARRCTTTCRCSSNRCSCSAGLDRRPPSPDGGCGGVVCPLPR